MLRLAWRYVTCYRWRSLVLMACVALVASLPIAVYLLLGRLEEGLLARARSTPMIVGAPGSRYDLLLSALYFRGRTPRELPLSELQAPGLADAELARALPLFARYRAGGLPIVGTDALAYLELRGLRLAAGDPPQRLGDVVLGAEAARQLEKGPGDHVISDVASVVDLTKSPPVRLRVTGVLARADSPDDGALICELQTSYLLHGLYHGHLDAAKVDPRAVLGRDGDNVQVDASVIPYIEVTDENLDAFHTHGDSSKYPTDALLLFPADDRARTLLLGRYDRREDVQLLTPTDAAGELLELVFQLRRVLDANMLLVGVAMGAMFGLVMVLQLRIRAAEMQTLLRIGCSRLRLTALLALELGLVVAGGALLTAAIVAALVRYGEQLLFLAQ